MPKCFVDYCRNYAGMRNNFANVILHVFPTTVERIKVWLRSIKRGAHWNFDLDEMAAKIHEGKKHDLYRVCSKHFSKSCYLLSGGKRVLRRDAIPTLFTKEEDAEPCNRDLRSKLRKELLSRRASKHLKKISKGYFQRHFQTQEATYVYKEKTSTIHNQDEVTKSLLNLTLDIIYLLTGEDYIVVKKSCTIITLDNSPLESAGFSRTHSPIMVPPPHSLIHEKKNEHILDLTKKIIELLTREVGECSAPRSKDVDMENTQTLLSLGECQESSTSQVWISSSVDMDTSVVSGYQQSNCFRIPNPTDNLERNASVLGEEENVIDTNYSKHCTQHASTHLNDKSASCEGRTFTDYAQYPTTHIKEEPLSCDGGNHMDTDIYKPADYIQSTSTQVKEERVSCDGLTVKVIDTYIPTDHTQSTSTHIKREPASFNEEKLTDTDIYTPTDHIQSTSTHIKEELVSCDGGTVTDTDIYTPTDHIQSTSTHIKEEPVSCDGGNIIDIVIYTPTDHIQSASTHIKEEPVSCDGGTVTDTDIYTPTDHTLSTSTHIKEEPVSWPGGNLTISNICTLIENTQSAYIKEETGTSQLENLVKNNIYISTENKLNTYIHIKEEPVSCDGGTVTDPDIYTHTDQTQSTSTHILETSHMSELRYSSGSDYCELVPCPQCQTCFISKYDLALHQGVHAAEKQIACGKRGKGKRVFAMSTFFPPFV